MTDSARPARRRSTKVRPRLSWGGAALALLGVVAIGFAMTLDAGAWTWAAVGVTVLGLLIAWRGGIAYDVHGVKPAGEELEEAVHGDAHQGVASGERLTGEEARGRAVAVSRQTRELLRDRVEAPAPPLAPMGTLMLLVLGAWLVIGKFALQYPFTITGQNSGNRDLGFALVLILAGLWLRQVGPSRVASGLCLLSGLLLVLAGLFLPHAAVRVQANELVVGTLVILSWAATLQPAREPRE